MKYHNLIIINNDSDIVSGCIRSALGDKQLFAGGYITRRAFRDETFFGFGLLPAYNYNSSGENGDIFLDCSSYPFTHYNDVYRINGRRYLEEAVGFPYCVIDEFGGFEVLLPEIRDSIPKLFSSSVPTLCSIKSEEQFRLYSSMLNLGKRSVDYFRKVSAQIFSADNTFVISASDTSEQDIINIILEWEAHNNI